MPTYLTPAQKAAMKYPIPADGKCAPKYGIATEYVYLIWEKKAWADITPDH